MQKHFYNFFRMNHIKADDENIDNYEYIDTLIIS